MPVTSQDPKQILEKLSAFFKKGCENSGNPLSESAFGKNAVKNH